MKAERGSSERSTTKGCSTDYVSSETLIEKGDSENSEEQEEMIPMQPIFVVVKKHAAKTHRDANDNKKMHNGKRMKRTGCKDLSEYREINRNLSMKKAMSELHSQLLSTATSAIKP